MISYHNQDIKFNFSGKRKVNKWVRKVVDIESNNKLFVGDIAFVFCSDDSILDINTKYLNHKHSTDVITFGYNENAIINGDVFIGVETVKINANKYKVDFIDELKRVLVHSILHLLGYNDSTAKEKIIMKSKEDYYLDLYDKNII